MNWVIFLTYSDSNLKSPGLIKVFKIIELSISDLFGVRGSPSSVIHVMSDEIQKCRAVLQNMLPRESLSKETDAALLTVIGYPAFAVNDRKLIEKTHFEVSSKVTL